jgi:hypothetical protein
MLFSFGKKRKTIRRRYRNVRPECYNLRKRSCKSNPNCTYTRRGCRGRSGTNVGLVYEGPALPPSTRSFGKSNRKPPARLIKLAKKYHVKISIKVGKKRVYKSLKVLLRQIKRKMKHQRPKKVRKSRNTRRKSGRKSRNTRRKSGRKSNRRYNFGSQGSYLTEYPQQGVIGQSSTWVDKASNKNRPDSIGYDKINTRLSDADLPVYGTYSRFFTEKVPKVLPPSWYCNKDKTGACTLVGGPFYGYKD